MEPPELIGGDISVTTADPSIVSDTVAVVKAVNPNVRVLCGAGVKSGAAYVAGGNCKPRHDKTIDWHCWDTLQDRCHIQ